MAEAKAGRYELREEIGRGAMGVVYKGFDPMIGRAVAVKTMKLAEDGSGLPRPDLVVRFQIETRAAGQLAHPNIVVIYDAGEDAGIFYITMEYIEGQSLQALLDKKQAFPIPRIMKVMEQACAALGYAHEHKVVHRDVKPANLMLKPDDTVKITDFGTAKILQLGTTQTGQIIGTPSYMSPEQVKGKPVDGRSDIFSLGVILYELVTGEKPFPGQNVTTVIYKIVHEDPIPPIELDSSVHPGLNHVITKALEKDPEKRYQTCREMMQELRRFRDVGARDMSQTVVVGHGRAPLSDAQKTAPMTSKTAETDSPTLAGLPVVALPPTQAAPSPTPAPAIPRASKTLPPLPYTPPEPKPPTSRRGQSGILWLTLLLLSLVGVGGYFLWPHFQQAGGGTVPATSTAQPESAPGQPANPERKEAGLAVRKPQPAETKPAERPLVEAKGASSSAEPKPAPRLRRGTGPAAGESSIAGEEKRHTSRAMGEITVTTDVTGALAALQGPEAGQNWQCHTPCRFEDLPPGRYTMDVTKEGYRPIKRILQVRANNVAEEKLTFQPLTSGIYVLSQPPKADVYVNGQKQPQPTPTTIRLAPGTYKIAVQKAGYEGYQGTIELQADMLKQINVQLPERPRGAGWVDTRTVPPGADILVNGTNIGRRTPARLELPSGEYTLTLYLRGYQAVRKQIIVEANKTVQVNEILPR